METKNEFVFEDGIFFYDTKIFGDAREHEYQVKCYDGHAVATKADDDDAKAPDTLYLTYPTKEEVVKDDKLKNEVLTYRGLPYDEEVTFGDIMICLGKFTTNKN